jgi:hypothetical protein
MMLCDLRRGADGGVISAARLHISVVDYSFALTPPCTLSHLPKRLPLVLLLPVGLSTLSTLLSGCSTPATLPVFVPARSVKLNLRLGLNRLHDGRSKILMSP